MMFSYPYILANHLLSRVPFTQLIMRLLFLLIATHSDKFISIARSFANVVVCDENSLQICFVTGIYKYVISAFE